MLVNVNVNKKNIILSWQEFPFSYDKIILYVKDVKQIHCGYSKIINPHICVKGKKNYTCYDLEENKPKKYDERQI